MKSQNTNLNKARATDSNDEFYTMMEDIEAELRHYKHHFEGKIIYCNCDDPKTSNFFSHFALKFQKDYKLKKLIATHFVPKNLFEQGGEPAYKLEICKEMDLNNDGKIDIDDTLTIPLKENGCFKSAECIETLKEVDIVVTNPPFSLFREYVGQLIEHNKKFLIIGNMNAITYKEIFKLIKNNKI